MSPDCWRPHPPVEISTSGDSGGRASESPASDKSRWVDTIEQALLAGEIDLAVHSAKDVPGELAEGLELLGAPARAAAEDVLCGAAGLDALAERARVGTSSVRRAAQLLAAREDLEIVTLAGNVDTRLRKLTSPDGGELRAIVLAHAGLQRLGRESDIGAVLDPQRFVPAPGQGVLALEGRAQDARVREAVQEITDADAFACLLAERALARELGASCNTPLGAHAAPAGCGCLAAARLGRSARRVGLGRGRAAGRVLRPGRARAARGGAHARSGRRRAAAPGRGDGH